MIQTPTVTIHVYLHQHPFVATSALAKSGTSSNIDGVMTHEVHSTGAAIKTCSMHSRINPQMYKHCKPGQDIATVWYSSQAHLHRIRTQERSSATSCCVVCGDECVPRFENNKHERVMRSCTISTGKAGDREREKKREEGAFCKQTCQQSDGGRSPLRSARTT